MPNKRLTVNMPSEWLDLLHEAARRQGCKSAGEYVRRMIVEDPLVLQVIKERKLKGLPNVRRKWGGRLGKRARARWAKEHNGPLAETHTLYGRPLDEDDDDGRGSAGASDTEGQTGETP